MVTEHEFLKPKQYYIDLYDRHTVEGCRQLIELHSRPVENPPLYKGKKPSEEMVKSVAGAALEFCLMFEKGDRYIKKEETIQKWMDDDQERDKVYENSKPPEGIQCLKCRSIMTVLDKTLFGGYNEPYRALFMYDCPNGCLPRRAFYDDSEEWIRKPNPCPKCGNQLSAEDKTTKSKFVTVYSCPSCKFSKTDELERTTTKKEEPDPNFETDRAKFCLSNEEGEKWKQELVNFEQMKKLVDEWKEKDKHKEEYDKVAKLKKLTVIELEKLLSSVFEKAGYTKLQFDKPEMGKDLFLPFTIYDSKSERRDRESSFELQKLSKKTLENTNWRLMSDGISYRSGILTGRFRAYEREEDLLKLVNSSNIK